MLPEFVLKAIRQRFGLEEDDCSQDDRINKLSLYETIDWYLAWEGVYGYTGAIMKIIEAKK